MKYRNKKVEVDGIKFDSREEASFYLDLKTMKERGEVISFELQPRKILIPSYKKYGKTIGAITYTPDFFVRCSDGREIYIDVKGFATEPSKLRKKIFDYVFPDLTLIWITKNKTYGDKYGWINKEELEAIRRKNKKASKEK